MDPAAVEAITDVTTLRALVREQLAVIAQRDAVIAERDAALVVREHTLACKEATIAKLTNELARLRRVHFAARSERMDSAQRELFDAATAADIAAVEAELATLQTPAQRHATLCGVYAMLAE